MIMIAVGAIIRFFISNTFLDGENDDQEKGVPSSGSLMISHGRDRIPFWQQESTPSPVYVKIDQVYQGFQLPQLLCLTHQISPSDPLQRDSFSDSPSLQSLSSHDDDDDPSLVLTAGSNRQP